tara:strand:+ start:390 stop:791 length:402 start_codon:yes stop_codon:yes gene_type:complete
MKKITVYTNESCSYCKQIKEELNKKNIEFTEKLTKDYWEEWQEVVNLTGLAMTPTTNYGNEYFIPARDYQNPQQLINLLQTFKKSKHSDSKRTLERMKTLNYHTNMAFGKLDQLLRRIENKLNIKENEHKSTN